MQGDFQITGEGRLSDDPKLQFLPSGMPMCKFTLVAQSRKFDKVSGEWTDGEVAFWNCTAWRKTAELIAESVQKGNWLTVTGTIGQRRYESQTGEKRVSYEIQVETVGVSLKWDAVKVLRTERASTGAAPVSGSAEDPWATNDQVTPTY